MNKKKYIVIAVLACVLLGGLVGGAEERVRITGEYTYTYGDSESLAQAKAICYSMAVRNAVESYKTFVTTTSTVKDYQLIKDLIQTISSGYIEDLKTVESTVNGRSVYAKVEGYIIPTIIDKVLKREVGRIQGKELEGITKNSYLKILKIRKRGNKVIVTFKFLHQVILSEQLKILIDFYDFQGDPIDGAVRRAEYYGDKSVPGELGTVTFELPSGTKSYRVWLPRKDELGETWWGYHTRESGEH